MRAPHRLLRALAAACLVATLLGCGSARYGRRLELPAEARLYIAVFVDETDEGRVGVPLADAVRVEVYRRDPSRLAMSFDEGTWALDGTVLALEEQPAADGRMRVTVRARARLLDKRGGIVAVLGPASSSSSYRVSRERAETEVRRAEALEDALRDLARQLVERVERHTGREGAEMAAPRSGRLEEPGRCTGRVVERSEELHEIGRRLYAARTNAVDAVVVEEA